MELLSQQQRMLWLHEMLLSQKCLIWLYLLLQRLRLSTTYVMHHDRYR